MKKFFSFVLVIIALAITLTACSIDITITNETDKTADELLETVLNSVQFPLTVEITDDSKIEDMGIDLSYVEEYAAVQQMLSVDVVEVIILKVKDGETSTAVKQLEARKESLINDFAFYPEQVASANATVVGSDMNVAYLICHVDAEGAEEALLEKISE